jgi:endonuclease/exonuclease/phosphatase family metal-dependent hydrolase
LVRSWNVYHGRTHPESRRLGLERMVRLITSDSPDVVCLQEVPLWACPRLGGWSELDAHAAATKRALAGPAAAFLQRLAPRLVRSPLTGQANALLVARRHEVLSVAAYRLNPQAREEARVCQLARLRVGAGALVVANVHATTRNVTAARRELAQVAELVASADPAIVCGDFNVAGEGLPGFSRPLPGIDQVLARGLELLAPPLVWPAARRQIDGGVLLSDHAPVEAEMMVP